MTPETKDLIAAAKRMISVTQYVGKDARMSQRLWCRFVDAHSGLARAIDNAKAARRSPRGRKA